MKFVLEKTDPGMLGNACSTFKVEQMSERYLYFQWAVEEAPSVIKRRLPVEISLPLSRFLKSHVGPPLTPFFRHASQLLADRKVDGSQDIYLLFNLFEGTMTPGSHLNLSFTTTTLL